MPNCCSVLRTGVVFLLHSPRPRPFQGPFTQAQLRGWRAWLPMALPLWHSDGLGGGSTIELALCTGGGQLLKESRGARGASSDAPPAPSSEAGGWAALGPSAAAYEAQHPPAPADSFESYAQAALAGVQRVCC